MRTLLSTLLILFLGVRAPLAIGQTETAPGPGVSDKGDTIVVEHGTAAFSVTTNMPGVTVKAKTEALHANVQMRRAPEGVTPDHIGASPPVKTSAPGHSFPD